MKVKRAPLKNGNSEKREFLKIYKKKTRRHGNDEKSII